MTATARRTSPRPTAADVDDVQAQAERAGEAFLAALREAIDHLPDRPQLEAPAERLREALERLNLGSAQPVLDAASAALQAFHWSARRDVTPSPDIGRNHARMRLPAVVAALDAALSPFERQAELDEAEQHVAQLRERQAQALAELEEAVSSADIDRVMTLRPTVEVELPLQLDQAELRVAELRVLRAEARQARPHRRAEAAAAAEAAARGALEEAQAAVRVREGELEAAAREALRAGQARGQVDGDVQALREERARLAERNARSAQERLRRLAGLPPETPTETVAAEPTLEQMIHRPSVTVREEPVFVLGGGQRVSAAEWEADQEERRAAFQRAKEQAARGPVVTVASDAADLHARRVRDAAGLAAGGVSVQQEQAVLRAGRR